MIYVQRMILWFLDVESLMMESQVGLRVCSNVDRDGGRPSSQGLFSLVKKQPTAARQKSVDSDIIEFK